MSSLSVCRRCTIEFTVLSLCNCELQHVSFSLDATFYLLTGFPFKMAGEGQGDVVRGRGSGGCVGGRQNTRNSVGLVPHIILSLLGYTHCQEHKFCSAPPSPLTLLFPFPLLLLFLRPTPYATSPSHLPLLPSLSPYLSTSYLSILEL